MNIQVNEQRDDITQAEQRLYEHWLHLVSVESPSQLVQRFRCLFIEGIGYPDTSVQADLDRVLTAPNAEQAFAFILNRCCHILINRWQSRLQVTSSEPSSAAGQAIADLVHLFETAPTRSGSAHPTRSRNIMLLRQRIRKFLQTEQYMALQRLVQVIHQPTASHNTPSQQSLGTLIHRYPYLYEHCLVGRGASNEQQASIRKLRAKRQQQFEIELSRYIADRIRCAQRVNTEAHIAADGGYSSCIQMVRNPTFLDEHSLQFALHQFIGKVESGRTCQDVAKQFLNQYTRPPSYQTFKQDFYQYLSTSAIESDYGRRQFQQQLSKQLKNTWPDRDSQLLNDFLIIRTCSTLLNFLVVESAKQPQHFILVDLLSHLGPTLTTRLLLKIVLLCHQVKPYLEGRFAILFHHYEAQNHSCMAWLIEAMENLHLALSLNFSKANFSFTDHLVKG